MNRVDPLQNTTSMIGNFTMRRIGNPAKYNADLFMEVNRRIRNAWCSFRKCILKLYDRSSDLPLELKLRMLRAEVLKIMLYGCVTWSPCAYHYDTLR